MSRSPSPQQRHRTDPSGALSDHRECEPSYSTFACVCMCWWRDMPSSYPRNVHCSSGLPKAREREREREREGGQLMEWQPPPPHKIFSEVSSDSRSDNMLLSRVLRNVL